MAIPFRRIDAGDPQGTAAYLRVTPAGKDELRGAVFLMNSRGEPVEFTYARAQIPGNFLWRPRDLQRAAVLNLACALFQAVRSTPALLLALASEMPPEILQQDISLEIPSIRVSTSGRLDPAASEDVGSITSDGDELEVAWFPARPPEDHPAASLLDVLAQRGLILEPFERMVGAMQEVFQAEQ